MEIRKMTEKDREHVFGLMKEFYSSPAVIHKSSDAVLHRDINACLSDNPFLFGYVFSENGESAGYAMVSMNYTTEYGGLCVWTEDIYIKEEYRHRGYSGEFFRFIEKEFPQAVRFKLQVEKENENAVAAYEKNGYRVSEYMLMTKEIISG